MKSVILGLFLLISTSLFAAIPRMEQKDFESLIKSARNASLPMTERWQALIRAGEIAKVSQLDEIKKFADSSEWYMRNASLVSLESNHSVEALEQAKKLVQDKALVVRSAAVSVLVKKNTLEVRRLLANELAKPYNFSGKQSLWIRPQIMKQIAKMAMSGDRQFLAQHLFDSDKKVAGYSAEALEKMSLIQFSGPKKIEQWQNYVKENGWL
ncbi:MAG: hypothetical protein A2622_01625 [Bdellovibrionales bacterium RIFCSPHIGHO2_01_FULL_40_29]|nr:MAG: hypothetical protein A2622_01625 [Bdellovibrionales bacterium RIFCSPHIGHO2_01_FULL_40_29]OFZ33795.1 MAG: hypothetical protein A3D17_02045 [Bdellovibrionales bacterium RIFCSPHIGHO2_02_FULL_40_15]